MSICQVSWDLPGYPFSGKKFGGGIYTRKTPTGSHTPCNDRNLADDIPIIAANFVLGDLCHPKPAMHSRECPCELTQWATGLVFYIVGARVRVRYYV